MHTISDMYRDPHPTALVRVIGRLAAGDEAGAREILLWEMKSHGSPWTRELHADPASATARLAGYQRAEGLPACECGCSEPPVLFLQDTTGLLDDPDDYINGEPPHWHGTPEVSADLTCVGCGTNLGTWPGGTAREAAEKARQSWIGYHAEAGETEGPPERGGGD